LPGGSLSMSPMPQSRSAKSAVPSNLYTAVLAVACAVVLASAAFVAFKCFTQYGVIFGMP
jgi:hypothetical protein